MTDDMTDNPHFRTVSSWQEAETLLTFRPIEPRHTESFDLVSIDVFVRDHRHREIPIAERSVEAHYGAFVLSQTRRPAAEARRLARKAFYPALISGLEAWVGELGPVPEPDDIDPRSPATVSWHDGELFFLLASNSLPADALLRIAASIRPQTTV